jgi:hypothetical protein
MNPFLNHFPVEDTQARNFEMSLELFKPNFLTLKSFFSLDLPFFEM